MQFNSNRPPEEVRAILRSIPDAIRGTGPDPYGLGVVWRSALIHSLLTSVYEGFIIKSLGGTDECGHRWPPLRPKTKAYHKEKLRKGIDLPGPLQRPTLTPGQNMMWKIIYSTTLTKLEKDIQTYTLRTPKRKPSSSREAGLKRFTDKFRSLFRRTHQAFNAFQASISLEQADARVYAAKKAWNFVKAKFGATTLYELLENAEAPILNETGRLQESYNPGPFTIPYFNTNPDIEIRFTPGHIHINSKVPYKPDQRSPRSPLPPDIRPWIQKAKLHAKQALIQKLQEIL